MRGGEGLGGGGGGDNYIISLFFFTFYTIPRELLLISLPCVSASAQTGTG